MFDHMFTSNSLRGEFDKYGLIEQDIIFIKEQIAGPLMNNEKVVLTKNTENTVPVAWTNHITTRRFRDLFVKATCSDTGSHNRLDLIKSLVPTHYVYQANSIISLFSNMMLW